MIRITIPLPPVTKKNSQRIVMVRNRPMILPSQKYKDYERDAMPALLPYRKGYTGPVNLRCLYYMPTRRRVDLCNLLEATCDLLVHHGVLADDNSAVVASHDGSRVLYDRDHPRTEIFLEEVPTDGSGL